ncbi:THUMP domain-containing protein [Paracidovorax citrulli]|uniref:THUMP domain-containing class I SAM-dependent RNA methyltransferase n=1 Tax=Paracidovorax citrulli TaxID=80869 RepID=UPI0005FB6046|nr:THUMP domain-containing protein [Paracidovorax citrulli]QCX11104.1 Ribosomal RNA large subunit methyltransferase L [Paracidovorax citrulli]UEG45923.1 THUMP domain-containing protein [Paracidovorax citrulli]UMT86782.1 RNA methyltransferase [Paracidovorax citrulli]UMT94823.1 RNA methyltransferase [Paracidovorax citrulli]WIY34378.1 THUMP domain-containing protein [Paracidovorax citrulli]
MNSLQIFLPCAAGVEGFLADEVHGITGLTGHDLLTGRGGVMARASWREALRLNLHSRLAQRVLVHLAERMYRSENDLYAIASGIAWEIWFTPRQSFRIDVTAQHSPLQSLNFAALRVKDAVADRFRAKAGGVRPDVDTQRPDVRIHLHLTTDQATVYIDTSGEPLFKRGWREDKGDAPLKETLAAAMIAASGWDPLGDAPVPLYDPCCGSGTIAIEAAQMACRIPPGLRRRFAFEKLLPFQAHVWNALREEAQDGIVPAAVPVFGSDVSHRMVDFAQRNAERAGVAQAVQLRGGDALQRMPPGDRPGVMLLNPPYGERIAAAGTAGRSARERMGVVERAGRETAQTEDGGDFFLQLAAHWKKHYAGWQAWMLTPDLKLPGKMRLKESRRVPMWNGPIECRLFRFDMVQGAVRPRAEGAAPPPADAPAGPGSAADAGRNHAG